MPAFRSIHKIRNYTVHSGFLLCVISVARNEQSIVYTP